MQIARDGLGRFYGLDRHQASLRAAVKKSKESRMWNRVDIPHREASPSRDKGAPMGQEFNVLALVKGPEHYIFVYDDASRQPLVDALRDNAADPRLSFNWFDAAVLTQKAREQAAAVPLAREPQARGRICE